MTHPFTPEAIAHYDSTNGTKFNGEGKPPVSPTLIHVCPTCVLIRAWMAAEVCPTCHRAYADDAVRDRVMSERAALVKRIVEDQFP